MLFTEPTFLFLFLPVLLRLSVLLAPAPAAGDRAAEATGRAHWLLLAD